MKGQFRLAEFQKHPHAAHFRSIQQRPVFLGKAVAGRRKNRLHIFRDQGHIVAKRGVGEDAAGLGRGRGTASPTGISLKIRFLCLGFFGHDRSPCYSLPVEKIVRVLAGPENSST